MRALATMTARHAVSSFIQYSSGNDAIIANVRFRYNPREGTDLYVVYDEGFNTDREREMPFLPRTRNRTILLKYSRTAGL